MLAENASRTLLPDECSSAASDADVVVVAEARALGTQAAQRRRLPACALVGVVAGALLVVALSRQAPGTLRAGNDHLSHTTFVEKKTSSLPLPYECSVSKIQNCHMSQCCLEFGFQCYEKNETYGACLETCDKGALLKAGNGSWRCNKLGLPRRCATAQENCGVFGCCAGAGHQCYAKDKYSATCMHTCNSTAMTAADPRKEAWSCDPIGTRYTPYHRDDYTPDYPKKALVEPWVKNCSHIGESCAETKCCAWTGYYCYEKNESWASCLSHCIPKKANGGISEKPKVQKGKPLSNPPPHNEPTFKHADPGPWTCKRLSVPETPSHLDGTSLFCFTTIMDDHGAGPTHDFELIGAAQKAHTFIFACDHWVVFSDREADLNPGKTVVVDFPKFVHRPNLKVWVNLPLFLNIWKSIKMEGTWKKYAWTIKADPYTVFIAHRLQYILRHQAVPASGVYLENCKYVRMGFHGSLEVISRDAFGTLLAHLDSCQTELPIENGTHTHFKYYGEDKFAAWCMHKHGVGRVPSRQEVETVPAEEPIYGLHITQSCPAHKKISVKDRRSKKWSPNCTRVRTAGVHGFRKVKDYMRCVKETLQESTFGS